MAAISKTTVFKAPFIVDSENMKTEKCTMNYKDPEKEKFVQLVRNTVKKYRNMPRNPTIRELLALKLQSDNWSNDWETKSFIHRKLDKDVFTLVDKAKFFKRHEIVKSSEKYVFNE